MASSTLSHFLISSDFSPTHILTISTNYIPHNVISYISLYSTLNSITDYVHYIRRSLHRLAATNVNACLPVAVIEHTALSLQTSDDHRHIGCSRYCRLFLVPPTHIQTSTLARVSDINNTTNNNVVVFFSKRDH